MTIRKGLMKDAAAGAVIGKALLFIPLAKIDEVEKTVTGIVTAEILDKAGEIFHYETSVPYFKAWSANMDRVTKGKSKGNVRAMHQPNAVGKIIDLQFDDGNKVITATAKIVDEGEWQKVVEGVYTGFSIGGSYVKQWKDEETQKNYFTADPVEVSIVDNPCVPVAHFTAVKADGVTEQRFFKLYEPTNDEVAAKAVELAGAKGDWVNHIEAAKAALKAEHGIPDFSKVGTGDEGMTDSTQTNKADDGDGDEGGGVEQGDNDGDEAKKKKKTKKADPEEEADESAAEEDEDDEEAAVKAAVVQVWKATDGTTFEKKADCVAHQATIKPELNPVEKAIAAANARLDSIAKATKPYGDIAYALEKDGVSLYPLDTELHIRSSLVFVHKSTKLTDEERAAALEVIHKAWAEKIGDEPPTADELKAFDGVKVTEAVKSLGAQELNKSFWVVGMWCRIVDDILCATSCVGWDHEDSEVPQLAKDICAALLTFMVKLVEAEVANTMSRLDKALRPAELEGFTKFLAGAIDRVPVVEDDRVEKVAFSKLEGEIEAVKAANVELQKQVSQAVDGFTELTARMTKFMNEPEPRPTLGRVVSKVEDRTGASEMPVTDQAGLKKLIEEHGVEGVAKMAIKISQQNGFTPNGSVSFRPQS